MFRNLNTIPMSQKISEIVGCHVPVSVREMNLESNSGLSFLCNVSLDREGTSKISGEWAEVSLK